MPLPPDNSHNSIHASNLSFGYGRTRVFERLMLDADSPVVVLKGPNGSGKTTLLKLLSGVFEPEHGGQVVCPCPVGIILQEDGLFPWLTVERSLRIAGISPSSDGAASALLSIVRPLMRKRSCSLSFGQRRVVELYRILSGPFRFLCLDEPFNFLDVATARVVADIIGALAASGTRFLIATHFYPEWLQWPHVIYQLDGSLPVRELHRAQAYDEGALS